MVTLRFIIPIVTAAAAKALANMVWKRARRYIFMPIIILQRTADKITDLAGGPALILECTSFDAKASYTKEGRMSCWTSVMMFLSWHFDSSRNGSNTESTCALEGKAHVEITRDCK